MASGVLVDVEVFVNATYGYDIRAEIVGESGTVALADTGDVTVKADGRRGGRVPADWRERFGATFDAEFQDWLKAAAAGTSTGPGAWDGYAATNHRRRLRRGAADRPPHLGVAPRASRLLPEGPVKKIAFLVQLNGSCRALRSS